MLSTKLAAPVADPGGGQYYEKCNYSGGCIFTTAGASPGLVRDYRNSTGLAGVMTIQMPASNAVDLNGANGATAGCLVSGGALGDEIIIKSDSTNHWDATVVSGTFTAASGSGCL